MSTTSGVKDESVVKVRARVSCHRVSPMDRRSASETLSLVNHTKYVVNISLNANGLHLFVATTPGTVASFGHVPKMSKPVLTLSTYAKDTNYLVSQSFKLHKSILGRQKWEAFQCDSYPWRVYRVQLHKGHEIIVVLPYRDLKSWMKLLPDTISLANTCLPDMFSCSAIKSRPKC